MQTLAKGFGVLRGITQAAKSGMRANPLSFWDVGARWGLSKQMSVLYRLGLMHPTFFEPDQQEAQRLRQRYRNSTVYNYALWNEDGSLPLYLTEERGQSSLLKPITLEPTASVAVPTIRAETLLCNGDVPSPEIIKLDIQGAEFAALTGFGKTLNTVVCIEAEVTFRPVYEGQPSVDQLTGLLMEHGLGLFDIQVFGVQSTRASINANAFYIRTNIRTDREASIEEVFKAINRVSVRP